ERIEQLLRDGMIRHADRDRILAARDDVVHRRSALCNDRERPRPECIRELLSFGRHLAHPTLQVARMIDVHDDWMSRRPSFDLENLANHLGIVRVRTEAVHGFRGERDELPRTQRFDGMQNLLLQNPCSDHPSIIAGAPNPRGARVRHVWRAANTEGPGVRYPLAASEATHLRARLLRGAGTIPFPAFVSTSELVHRPILIVELERDDFHRAVPGQRSQAQGAAVLASGDGAYERIEIGSRLSVDLRDPSASPQLIARGGRAVREVGNEDALRSYTALGRERAMRSLQHRAGPYDDAVERRALQCD